MTPFLPDTPWPICYAVTLAVVSVTALYRSPGLWPVVAVMAANWLATRTVSAHELPGLWQAAADTASAAALIAIRRPTMVVLPVAALYLAVVFSSAAHDAGLLSRDSMWAFADVAGYLQLLIIMGGALRGGRRHGVGLGGHLGRRSGGELALAPVRVSREAISGDHPGGG